MTAEQRQLWERIQAFSLDDGAPAFPFAARLARENDWPRGFAERAIAEYRKFVFLAVAAGHPVSPSDQVDQVWHLHLLYTRNYWEGFCREVLRTPLHHGPTRGGESERAKFHDWYSRTLDSYRRFFRSAPPADLWPPPAVRFGEDLHYRRVNLKRHWVIPKPKVRLPW